MKTQINYQSNIQQQWLPHESLLVYAMAMKFHIGAMTLLTKRGYPNLRDQLERASLSIVLNIAEGADRKSAADRAHFFTIVMGSLLESGASSKFSSVVTSPIPPAAETAASTSSTSPGCSHGWRRRRGEMALGSAARRLASARARLRAHRLKVEI